MLINSVKTSYNINTPKNTHKVKVLLGHPWLYDENGQPTGIIAEMLNKFFNKKNYLYSVYPEEELSLEFYYGPKNTPEGLLIKEIPILLIFKQDTNSDLYSKFLNTLTSAFSQDTYKILLQNSSLIFIEEEIYSILKSRIENWISSFSQIVLFPSYGNWESILETPYSVIILSQPTFNTIVSKLSDKTLISLKYIDTIGIYVKGILSEEFYGWYSSFISQKEFVQILKKHLFPSTKKKYISDKANVIENTNKWKEIIIDVAKKYGIDWRLIAAIIEAESNFNSYAVSPKGAIGLMQVMGDLPNITPDELFDPVKNINVGVEYLMRLKKMWLSITDDDSLSIIFAIASYNAGPKYIIEVIKKIPDTLIKSFYDPINFANWIASDTSFLKDEDDTLNLLYKWNKTETSLFLKRVFKTYTLLKNTT